VKKVEEEVKKVEEPVKIRAEKKDKSPTRVIKIDKDKNKDRAMT